FLATLTVLCTLTLTGIVAFRLAPETWAMIAGVVFGLVAALPMCAIVVLLIRRQPVAPPPAPPVQPQAYAPPQFILLHPGGPTVRAYGGQVVAPQRMFAPPTYAAWDADGERADGATNDGYWDGSDAYAAPEWTAPALPRGQ